MRRNASLNTAQWVLLQRLFEESLQAEPDALSTLLQGAHAEDALVGEALSAMLGAHARWEGRTGEAIGDWRTQAGDVATLATGTQVGPYRIVDKLGAGGMGVVYRAERADGAVTQAAAIKVLRNGVLDADSRERFRRERDLLARFSHPHIARLFDAGVTGDGQPYFVMEYVRGANITQYCDEHRLPIAARLRLFLKVCDAVRYAHGQLVLHRDIKSSNVLVDEHGEPKLIDFGIAKPLLHGADIAATVTHQRFFSPLNAAPEQLEGGATGVACDVYQLGTLLYELLCGCAIFELEGKSPGAIEEAIRHQIPALPSARNEAGDVAIAQARHCGDVHALRRQLRGDLDAIAMYALRKDPARRYASVEQLIDDVNRYLEQRPVHGRRGTVRYRTSLYLRRNWRALSLAALVFAGSCAFGFMVISERNKAMGERGRADDMTQLILGALKSADPFRAEGDLSARQLFERIAQRALDDTAPTAVRDPAARAALLSGIGQIGVRLGSLKQSLEAFEHVDVAALDEAAREPYWIGRTNALAALVRYKEASAMLAQHWDGDPSRIPWVWNDVLIAWGMGDDDAVIAKVKAAAARQSQPLEDAMRNRLALAYMRKGELEEAGAQFRALLADQRRSQPEGHANLIPTLLGLTSFGLHTSNLNPARSSVDEALALTERHFGRRSQRTSEALDLKQDVLRRQGQLQPALALEAEVLSIRTEQFGANHPGVAQSHYKLGYLYELLNDPVQAEEHYRTSLRIGAASLPAGHPGLFTWRTVAAAFYVKRGHFDEAATLIEETLRGVAANTAATKYDEYGLARLVEAVSAYGQHRTDADAVRKALHEARDGARRWGVANAIKELLPAIRRLGIDPDK